MTRTGVCGKPSVSSVVLDAAPWPSRQSPNNASTESCIPAVRSPFTASSERGRYSSGPVIILMILEHLRSAGHISLGASGGFRPALG